jgi:MYXO-CTERM domain-containing protein
MNKQSKSVLRRSTGVLLSAGVVFSVAATAQAAPTVEMKTGVLLVKQSLDGKVRQDTGAGVMMTQLVSMANNQLMSVWMDSDVPTPNGSPNDNNNGMWEGKLSVVQLNQKGAPSIVVPPTQFTSFGGDRPFNHPSVAADPTGKYVVVAFASSKDDQDNTQEYAMVLDTTGKVLVPAMHIGLQDDGNNTGATNIRFTHVDGSGNARFMVGYQHNNNESYVAGLSLATTGATPALTQAFNTQFYRPTNIGRPEIAVIDTTSSTVCTEVGNNRPPEYGIGCAVIDNDKGTIITGGGNQRDGNGNKSSVTNGIVVPSNAYDSNGNPTSNPTYMNQATLAFLGNGLCALGVSESNGAGKNTNRGGSNITHAYTINCKTLAVVSSTDPMTPVAPWQRHSTLLTTEFGNQGQIFSAHIGCSETGAGSAAVQMVPVDATGKIGALDKAAQLLPISWACDSAMLSNKGLRNPNDQGRDFIKALPNVANPGYQVPGGWMPEAKSFLVTAVPFVEGLNSPTMSSSNGTGSGSGKGGGGGGGGGGNNSNPNEVLTRNSLHLSFLPIAWDPAVQVVMSAAVDVLQVPAGPSVCVQNCPTDPTSPYSPANPTGNSNPKNPTSPIFNPNNNRETFGASSSGGGCNIAQTPGSDTGELAGGMALVGLVVVASRRRRS